MRGAGAVVAEMHEACTRAAKPGATTADLDARRPRGARPPARPLELPRLPRVSGGGVHLAERGDRARHPRRPGARRRRHRLDRLRGDHRGLARRRRDHGPGRRGRRGVAAADRRHPGRRSTPRSRQASAGNRLGDIGAAGRGVWSPRPASRWCGSTSATGSAPPCTRSPTSRTTDPAGRGLKLQAGHGARDRADGQRGRADDPAPRRRLDGGHRRRLALGALRAHGRDHRRRSRGADRCPESRSASPLGGRPDQVFFSVGPCPFCAPVSRRVALAQFQPEGDALWSSPRTT